MGSKQERAPRTDPGAFQYLEVRGEEKPVKEKSLCMEKSRSEEIRRAGILEVKRKNIPRKRHQLTMLSASNGPRSRMIIEQGFSNVGDTGGLNKRSFGGVRRGKPDQSHGELKYRPHIQRLFL